MRSLFARRKTPFAHRAYFENVLGTSLEIQLIGTSEAAGPRAETAILAEIDRLSAIFNAYDAKSELSRWQTSFDEEIAVSGELAEVLAQAEAWQKRSGGGFNPAVEAMTRVWQRAQRENRAVPPRELEDLAAQIEGPLWEVDAEKGSARRLIRHPVTLNSIAKGFIIDRAAEVGASIEGVEQVMVNIGGDLRHIGAQKMAVAIADPRRDAENALPVARLAIGNQATATSGDYRRGFEVGNRWFSHLIDPRSGWPVEKASGVSVVAPSALQADVLATIFSVLSIEESLEMADSLAEVSVLLVGASGAQCNAAWRALAARGSLSRR